MTKANDYLRLAEDDGAPASRSRPRRGRTGRAICARHRATEAARWRTRSCSSRSSSAPPRALPKTPRWRASACLSAPQSDVSAVGAPCAAELALSGATRAVHRQSRPRQKLYQRGPPRSKKSRRGRLICREKGKPFADVIGLPNPWPPVEAGRRNSMSGQFLRLVSTNSSWNGATGKRETGVAPGAVVVKPLWRQCWFGLSGACM